MIPAAARRQLMSDFQAPVQRAMRDATTQGVPNATMLLLDLRDDRAQKLAADVADLDTVRDVVASAERDATSPVLLACASGGDAAELLRGHSRKAKRKFSVQLPLGRFRMVVVSSGGITWAVGALSEQGPTGRIVG